MARIRFEPILPKRKQIVNTRKLLSGLQRAIDDTIAIADRDFNATVKTWKKKPKFSKKKATRRAYGIEGLVTTKNEIYMYVTMGTKRHRVPKHGKKLLRFRSKYRAKTRSRVLGSRAGGASGSFAYSMGHYVKGIKAREFQQEIALRRRRNLWNFTIRAWAEAMR